MRHLLPIACVNSAYTSARRVKTWAVPFTLALALPACATMPETGIHVSTVTTAITRASEAWTVIKATAGLWMPRLSPERQLQVQHAIAIGDQAILTAQTAATVAEATAALGQVNVAAGQVTAATR